MKSPQAKKLAWLVTLAAPCVAFGQATTPPPTAASNTTSSATPDQIVQLDPFNVETNRDVGYTAVDSLAGGRSNLPLRVTAAPISSLTRAFIDDVQLTNVRDALRWTGGAVPQNWRGGWAAGGEFNAWGFNIRGQGEFLQGGNPPTRNYFPNYVIQDLYNVDRVEVARGPNSILFGVGDIGGSIATYTKTPRFDKDVDTATVMVNQWGGVRFTADSNRLVSSELAVRTNVLAERERGWRDSQKAQAYGLDVAATYKFNNNSKLRVELEGYDRKNNIFGFMLQDNFSLWNGTTSSPTWGATVPNAGANPLTTAGAPGVTQMTSWSSTEYVIIPGLESAGALDWHSGYRSMGTNDVGWGAYLRPYSYTFGPTSTMIPAMPSKEFTIAPANAYLRSRYASLTAWWDQRINESMEFQLAAYGYQDAQRSHNRESSTQVAVDLNQQLPNGQANPNYGKRYSEFFLSNQNQFHPAREIRAQLNYHFDSTPFNVPLKQWFGVSAGYRRTELRARTYLGFDTPNLTPDNWAQHMVWARLYWDNPRASINLPANSGGRQFGYYATPLNWFDFDLQEKIKYAGIVSQSRLWNDRLNLTLGARRDSYENHKANLRVKGTPTELKESGTTLQGGVVGYITPWLALNYNYSENFAPLGGGVAPTLYGQPLNAAKGKGQTIGLRVSTENGKYYAQLNYYVDKSQGRPKGGPDFQGTWNSYFRLGGTDTNIGPSGTVTGSGTNANASMSFSDTTDLESKGWELELTANPTENIRLQMSLSVPKSDLVNSLPNSVRYYNEHIQAWQAIANATGGTPTQQTDRQKFQSDLTRLKSTIDTAGARTVNDFLVKSTFSFFGTYIFTNDALRGFSVGGGATVLGKQYGRVTDLVNGQRILSPGYTLFNAMVAYETHVPIASHRVRTKFQLNVDNLLGNDKLIYRSYQAYGSSLAQPMEYDAIEPRRFTLSVTFTL